MDHVSGVVEDFHVAAVPGDQAQLCIDDAIDAVGRDSMPL
jgi:hypothetical protein